MDVLLRAWRAVPWSPCWSSLRGRTVEACVAGGLLGVLGACAWTQSMAHWGTSAPVQRGTAAAVLTSLLGGFLLQRVSRWSWPLWLMVSATLALIGPWWLDRVDGILALLPAEALSSGHRLDGVGFVIACLSIGLPVCCWTATACALFRRPLTSCAALGAAGGILLNALCFGPWVGAEFASVAAAGTALALASRALRRTAETSNEPSWIAPRSAWIGIPGMFFGGGVCALATQHCQMLMLPSVAMQQAAWAVQVAGLCAGLQIVGRWPGIRSWPLRGILLGLVVLSLQGWAFEFGLQLSLWSSAYLINVALHQLALVLLLAMLLLPISLSAGLMIGTAESRRARLGLVCFLSGSFVFYEMQWAIAPDVGTIVLMGGLSGLIILGVLANNGSKNIAAALAGLACGLAAFWLQPAVNPARAAKLLFSTQTFLAYRSAWDAELLPNLDDSRLIAAAAGRQGPLTLWKSRGSELLLREAGIPRCSIACRPDISPQSSAEVLATVFPLMVSSESRNILVLGSSGGVPLSTFLGFPVERVVCVEPDAARVELIRGPIAAHQGTDPFADDRVTWDRRPIEFAAAMSDGGYDIILSSPPPSSTVAALPQFTQEFYRNVSGKLSPTGLFCQRMEAVDFGPRPVQHVVQAIQSAFQNVAAVEIGVGDVLLMATNSEAGLVPKDLPQRLETPHVRRILANCGWDWSMLLTLPAWDHAALREFAADGSQRANTASNCQLAFTGPREVLRWGPKLQETQALLTKPRAEELTQDDAAMDGQSTPVASRRSRYLDWLGEPVVSQDLLRRLSEVAAQAKIVHDNPDAFWLEYRKALRDELQQRPRTEIRQVSATDGAERVLHPEDERRKSYFVALGIAGDLEERNLDAVYALRNYFEPYDPLVSLFARQETAELLRYYGHPDPAWELALRLHVIYFAPASDCSLRNVLAAAELLLDFEAAMPDPQTRFDTMNGLLQTIRTRWDMRSAAQVKSVRLAIQDTERSMLVIERLVDAMDDLAATSQVNAPEWPARREVAARILLRPLRGYRAELQSIQKKNKATTDAVIEDAKTNFKF